MGARAERDPLANPLIDALEARVDGVQATAEEAAVAAAAASLPSGQKAALAGTAGTPGAGNKYVTDQDFRNTNSRSPTGHKESHATGGDDALTPADIGAATAGAASAAQSTADGAVVLAETTTLSKSAAYTLTGQNLVVLADATGQLPPTNLAGTPSASGGTFSGPARQFYMVTATGPNGESVGSNEAQVIVTTNGSVVLTWTAAAGATGYKVYRTTTPNSQRSGSTLIATLGNVTTYTDTNASAGSGSVPATNGGAFTLTLPTAVGFKGRYIINAITTGPNAVTVATSSAQTIQPPTGAAVSSVTVGPPLSGATYQSVALVSDGANWRLV